MQLYLPLGIRREQFVGSQSIMAKNNTVNSASTAPQAPGKKSKLPGYITLFSFVICVSSVAVLFASSHEVGLLHMGMGKNKYALGLTAAIPIFAILGFFMNAKSNKASHLEFQTNLENMRANAEALVSKADEKIEKYLGSEYERLTSENAEFRSQIETAEQEKEAGLAAQIDELRKKNAELQEQINSWAASKTIQPVSTSDTQIHTEDQLRVG